MATIKRNCQVVMMSSDDKIHYHQLCLNKSHRPNRLILMYSEGYSYAKVQEHNEEPQHLYILSNDEIKEGDFFMSTFLSYPLHNLKGKYTEYPDTTNCKKIIATTNESLGLPKLSKQFIDNYALSYNSGSIKNPTEIMVEYELDGPYMGHFEEVDCSDFKLKVNESNEILISAVKNNWTREEVINLLEKVLQSTGLTIQAEIRCIITGSAPNLKLNYNGNDLKRWIEQNLQ